VDYRVILLFWEIAVPHSLTHSLTHSLSHTHTFDPICYIHLQSMKTTDHNFFFLAGSTTTTE